MEYSRGVRKEVGRWPQEVGQVCLVGVDTVEMDMLQIRCQICSCEVWGGGSYFWKGGSQKGGFGRTPPGYGPEV